MSPVRNLELRIRRFRADDVKLHPHMVEADAINQRLEDERIGKPSNRLKI